MKSLDARKITLFLLAVIVVLISLHLIFQYLNFVVFNEKHGQVFEISNRLDVDDEVSVPTWFSQFILLGLGFCGWFLAWLEKDRLRRLLWKVVGVVGVLFSVDEVSSLHEFVLQSIHLLSFGEAAPTSRLNAWWIVLPFVVAVAIILGFIAIKRLPTKTWILMAIGGVVYLVGGGAIDLISNDFPKNSYLYQGVLTGIEEAMELIGVLGILHAMMLYIEQNYQSKLIQAKKVLLDR